MYTYLCIYIHRYIGGAAGVDEARRYVAILHTYIPTYIQTSLYTYMNICIHAYIGVDICIHTYTGVAGVDEAGRGPLAGPVVAAAVILPPDFDDSGVNDSKKLTEEEVRTFFPPHSYVFPLATLYLFPPNCMSSRRIYMFSRQILTIPLYM